MTFGEKNTERYGKYFRVDIGMTRKNGNLFGLKYDINKILDSKIQEIKQYIEY